jgi:hypothetical protein
MLRFVRPGRFVCGVRDDRPRTGREGSVMTAYADILALADSYLDRACNATSPAEETALLAAAEELAETHKLLTRLYHKENPSVPVAPLVKPAVQPTVKAAPTVKTDEQLIEEEFKLRVAQAKTQTVHPPLYVKRGSSYIPLKGGERKPRLTVGDTLYVKPMGGRRYREYGKLGMGSSVIKN